MTVLPRAVRIIALVALMCLPLSAMDFHEYENAGIDDSLLVKNFVDELKKAVAANDAKTLSRMVAYPLNEYEMNKETGDCVFVLMIRTPKQFVAEFSNIFTDDVKAAIRRSPDEHLFHNYVGVMIGSGEVWMDQIGNDIKIGQMHRSVKTGH